MRPGLVLAGLCAAVFAPAQDKDREKDKAAPDAVRQLIAQLGEPDYQRRSAAYSTLQRERPPAALALLVEALPGYEPSAQNLALSLFHSYPLDTARPALQRLLRAPSPLLRLGAAAILYRGGDAGAVEILVRALGDAGASGSELAMMLGRIYGIGDARVAAAVRALVRAEAEAQVVDNALYHLLLTQDRDTPAVVTGLAATQGLPLDFRAVCAAYLLTQGEGSQGDLVAEAIRARGGAIVVRLSRFLNRAPKLPQPVLDAIAAHIEAADASGYLPTSIGVLGQHGGSKEVLLLRKLLKHGDAHVARAALDAMQRLTGALPPDALRTLLASPQPEVALVAADTLRRLDDPSGLPRVVELLAAPGSHRSEAARVLGRFKVPAAVPALLDALADDDTNVRTQAYQGVNSLLPSLFPYRRFDLAAAGYVATGPTAARDAALARLRAWWDQNRPR